MWDRSKVSQMAERATQIKRSWVQFPPRSNEIVLLNITRIYGCITICRKEVLFKCHLNTVTIWIWDKSGIQNGRFVFGCQMVQFLNGGLKTRLKKPCLWSKMSSIQMVSQVMWLYHLNIEHPYCLVFRCSVFRWLLY